MATYEDILIDTPKPHVLLITLNRPKMRNALRTQTLDEIADALNAAEADDNLRAVVLTGGPDVFAAGADINELAAHDAVSIQADPRVGHWKTVRAFAKPLIAAVNGYCLGGGNELAMHADIIIAGEAAQFGQPEVNLGVIPGAGGTQRLTHAVGKSLAMKMVLAAAFIDAPTALAAGLAAEVVPPENTIERAVELAETIAAKAPLAIRLAKESVIKAYEMNLESGLQFERKAFSLLFATDDRTEGINAFKEKRKPQYKGR
jgi:enoyl-CoA hydratase